MWAEKRNSGSDLIGCILQGTRFCQFYETPEYRTSILVLYFSSSLERNEYCMWVTTEPVVEKSARKAMRKAMPSSDCLLKNGKGGLRHTDGQIANMDSPPKIG